MNQFQLFPSPTPVRGSKNPFRKDVQKPAVKVDPGSPISLQQVKDSTKTEAVLLQIIEDTQSITPAQSTDPVSRSVSPAMTELPGAPALPHSSRSHNPQVTKPARRAPDAWGSVSSSSPSRQTMAAAASPQSSRTSASPVPMRSMFPKFDPKLPVDQQNYHPRISNELPRTKSRRPQLTLSPTSEIDQVLGPKTVPASVLNFPTGVLEADEIRYSSPRELEILWEAANGQRPQNLVGTFNLQMSKCGISHLYTRSITDFIKGLGRRHSSSATPNNPSIR